MYLSVSLTLDFMICYLYMYYYWWCLLS